MAFETNEERILKDLVFVPSLYSESVDYGKDFIRVKDKKTGKIFEIKVKEKK